MPDHHEPRPLFVLVADVGYCIDLYSNFAGVGDQFVPFPDQTRYRLSLSKLEEEETREMLRLIFTDPRELDPSRRAARVTRELAEYLAKLSTQLERAGHTPDLVAQFLMRCLFTMFSEGVGLIPKDSRRSHHLLLFLSLYLLFSTPTRSHHFSTGQVEHFGKFPVQMCFPNGISNRLMSIQRLRATSSSNTFRVCSGCLVLT